MKRTMTVIEFTERHIRCLQASGRNGALKISCDIRDPADPKFPYNIRSEALEVMIPSRHATLRYADFPSNDPVEIGKMIELQITRFTPHAREDIVFDFLVLETLPSGYSRVLLIMVPRDVVARYLSRLEKAKVVPYRLTISAAGLWRWCCPATPSMLVHVGDTTLDICFCRRGQLSFIRSVPFDPETVMGDIRQAVDIYEAEVGGEPLKKSVLLVQDQARTVSLKKIVEEQCGCPVETFSYPPDMAVPDAAASYFAALGVICQDRPCFLNFLPPEIKERHRRRVRQKQRLTSALLITVIGILWLIVLGKSIRTESIYAGQLQEQARQMSSIVQHITETKEQVEFLEKEVLSQALIADIFRRLSLLMPENVSLESFSSRDGEHCTLKGISGDDAGVNQLYRNLVDSHAFSDVILEYSKKRKVQGRELTEFRIRCVVTFVQETL